MSRPGLMSRPDLMSRHASLPDLMSRHASRPDLMSRHASRHATRFLGKEAGGKIGEPLSWGFSL